MLAINSASQDNTTNHNEQKEGMNGNLNDIKASGICTPTIPASTISELKKTQNVTESTDINNDENDDIDMDSDNNAASNISLYYDLYSYIFEFIPDLKSLASAVLVCRTFNRVIEENMDKFASGISRSYIQNINNSTWSTPSSSECEEMEDCECGAHKIFPISEGNLKIWLRYVDRNVSQIADITVLSKLTASLNILYSKYNEIHYWAQYILSKQFTNLFKNSVLVQRLQILEPTLFHQVSVLHNMYAALKTKPADATKVLGAFWKRICITSTPLPDMLRMTYKVTEIKTGVRTFNINSKQVFLYNLEQYYLFELIKYYVNWKAGFFVAGGAILTSLIAEIQHTTRSDLDIFAFGMGSDEFDNHIEIFELNLMNDSVSFTFKRSSFGTRTIELGVGVTIQFIFICKVETISSILNGFDHSILGVAYLPDKNTLVCTNAFLKSLDFGHSFIYTANNNKRILFLSLIQRLRKYARKNLKHFIVPTSVDLQLIEDLLNLELCPELQFIEEYDAEQLQDIQLIEEYDVELLKEPQQEQPDMKLCNNISEKIQYIWNLTDIHRMGFGYGICNFDFGAIKSKIFASYR